MAASLRLDFEREALSDRTLLAASHQEPPLKVVRAFAVEDGGALAHLHNVSGGLLGGDRLELAVNGGAGAQGAADNDRGHTNIPAARGRRWRPLNRRNEITVGENGLLEYLPDAVIPFAGGAIFAADLDSVGRGGGIVLVGDSGAGARGAGRSFRVRERGIWDRFGSGRAAGGG